MTDSPTHTKDETSKYTDLMPDGKARQFTYVMGVNLSLEPMGAYAMNTYSAVAFRSAIAIVTAVVISGLLVACARQASAQKTAAHGPGLGRAATGQEIAAWDISIPPATQDCRRAAVR